MVHLLAAAFDEVEDVLLQSMLLWHIKYLKLKEFEKIAEVKRSF